MCWLSVLLTVFAFFVGISSLNISGSINGCKYTYIDKPFSVKGELSINATLSGIEVTCTALDEQYLAIHFNEQQIIPGDGKQQSITFTLNCVDGVYQYNTDPSMASLNVTTFACHEAQNPELEPKQAKECMVNSDVKFPPEYNARSTVISTVNGLEVTCEADKGKVASVEFNNSFIVPANGNTNLITFNLECFENVYQYKNNTSGFVLNVTSYACLQTTS